MKIVFFSSDNNISSGAYRAEINLINDLIKKGHDVTLVVPYNGTGNKLSKKHNINRKTIFSVFWVCLYPKTIIDFLFYWLTFPINAVAGIRTRFFLKKNKFDLVVMNTVWNGIGAEQANKLGIPVAWHLREILEEGQHRRFYNRNKSFEIMSKAKTYIPVSKKVIDKFSGNLSKEKMKLVYDGVDINKFYCENEIFKDKTIHILMVGRIFKEKGQHLAIKALNKLSKYNFDITFVGYGYPTYIKKLKRMGKNIKDKMFFVGPTNDVNKYYRKADIFLMNSVGEAFGLVTVEAMLNGLVVIASKCDGQLEIISSDRYGYFYEPLNVDDLKTKIEYVFNNKKEALFKAKDGQARIKNNFSLEKNCNEIEKIYLNVVKG